MWPFKNVKPIDNPRDPSPCSHPERHYYWESSESREKIPCPFCVLDKKIAMEAKQKQQQQEKERQQQEELAELIAEKVVRNLKGVLR